MIIWTSTLHLNWTSKNSFGLQERKNKNILRRLIWYFYGSLLIHISRLLHHLRVFVPGGDVVMVSHPASTLWNPPPKHTHTHTPSAPHSSPVLHSVHRQIILFWHHSLAVGLFLPARRQSLRSHTLCAASWWEPTAGCHIVCAPSLSLPPQPFLRCTRLSWLTLCSLLRSR